jgi:rod shape-determining protein MreD
MFQKIIFFVFISLLVVLQFSFFPNLFSKFTTPDLILIVIVFWSISIGFMGIWKKVVVAGFLLDLIYAWPIGVNILAFSSVSFFLTSVSKRLFMRRKLLGFSAALAIIAFATPAYYLIVKGISEFLRAGYIMKSDVKIINLTPIFILQKSLMNVILMALLYLPLEKIEKFSGFYSKKSAYEGRFFKK